MKRPALSSTGRDMDCALRKCLKDVKRFSADKFKIRNVWIYKPEP